MKVCNVEPHENAHSLCRESVEENVQLRYEPDVVDSKEYYTAQVQRTPDMMPGPWFLVQVDAYDGDQHLWSNPVATTSDMRIIDALTLAESKPNLLAA